jgi:ribulose bisphosphate carboxylase small subunit
MYSQTYKRVVGIDSFGVLKKTANFPDCLGADDGKYIRVIKPEHSGSMFYNYKVFFHGINGRGRHQLPLYVR